ncbi:MAG: hypothetical protein ACOYT4_03815 [Nanoarchaeota archaeon]
MENKEYIALLLLFSTLLILNVAFISAVPAPPNPTCQVEAKITELEKTRTDFSRFDSDLIDFEYYKIRLDISNISTYKKDGNISCDEHYKELAENSDLILTLEEYNKTSLKKDDKINAKIHFKGDEWFNGYYVSDVQIINGKINPMYYIIPIIILIILIFYIILKIK